MKETPEKTIATSINGLLLPNLNNDNVLEIFNTVYKVTTENNLQSIKLYIEFEEIFSKQPLQENIMIKILNKIFFNYNYNDFKIVFGDKSVDKYVFWKRVADVVFCLQPVVFHYINEKEFFATWQHDKMRWVKNG